jgi:hypothetical protein
MQNLTIAPRVGDRYLRELEDAIQFKIPKELKEVLRKYTGLMVNEDKFHDSQGRVWEIQAFDNIQSIIDLSIEFRDKGLLLIPFAFDPGGWHFCLSYESSNQGKIIVNRWSDHSPDKQLLEICNSLEEFIDGLKP